MRARTTFLTKPYCAYKGHYCKTTCPSYRFIYLQSLLYPYFVIESATLISAAKQKCLKFDIKENKKQQIKYNKIRHFRIIYQL